MIENFKRRYELDYMNAAGCLLVILIHVLSFGIGKADPASWKTFIIYMPWRVAAFVVPMFLFTSAVKMSSFFGGSRITARKYATYMLERLRHIYLPYVIWVVLYYLYFYSINYVSGSPWELIPYILIGNLSGHFYYIVLAMQFYLLMPLWIRMTSRVPAAAATGGAVVITVALQLLNSSGHGFMYFDRFFMFYLMFWIPGLYIGKNYERAARMLRRVKALAVVFMSALVLCGAAAAFAQFRGGYVFNLDFIKTVVDILSIAVLWRVCLAVSDSDGAVRVKNLLGKICRSSYQVYLSHCLFVTMATVYLGSYVTQISLTLIVRFIVGYSVPFLVCWATGKVRNKVHDLTVRHSAG